MKDSVKAQFFSAMADSLGAGMSPVQAFELLSDSRDYGALAAELKQKVFDGTSMTDSMRSSAAFNEMDIAMIEAGERSGTLDVQCRRLAARYDDLSHVLFSFTLGLGYPCAILVTMFVIVWFVLALTPPDASVIRDAAVMMRTMALVLLGVVGGVMLAHPALIAYPWYQKLCLSLPSIPGKFMRLRAYSMLTSNIRMLYSSGYTLDRALELGARGTGMSLLESGAAPVVNQLKKGQSFESCARLLADFPDEIVLAIKLGEKSGTIDKSLQRIEENYVRDLKVVVAALPGYLAKTVYFAALAIALVFILPVLKMIVDFYTWTDQL